MDQANDVAGAELIDTVLTLADADDSLAEEAKFVVLAALEGGDWLDRALDGARLAVPAPQAKVERPVGAYLQSISVKGFRGIGPAAVLGLQPGPRPDGGRRPERLGQVDIRRGVGDGPDRQQLPVEQQGQAVGGVEGWLAQPARWRALRDPGATGRGGCRPDHCVRELAGRSGSGRPQALGAAGRPAA